MALLQGLFLALFRFVGKILNTAVSWATIMLFGKVDQHRQIYLSLAAFGSLIWLVALLGTAFPGFGLWLLSFVRLPAGVDPDWVRLGMLAGIIILPIVVGTSLLVLFERGRRARRGGFLRTVLRGYPYTLGLATTMLVMSVFAPVVNLRNLARRWTTMHVPIIIEAKYYAEVVGEVQDALASGGITTTRQPAPLALRVSLKILAVVGGRTAHSPAGDELTILRARGAEILLHPSDLVIGAPGADAARIRAILATRLIRTRAYLTYSRAANEMEDKIRTLWEEVRARTAQPDDLEALGALEEHLTTLPLDFEEWEVLHRQILLLDRRIRSALTTLVTEGRPIPGVSQAGLVGAPLVSRRGDSGASGGAGTPGGDGRDPGLRSPRRTPRA